jgi:glycosyltransferase involved in cell wall biosynthesis
MFNLNASISIVLPVYNEENNLQNLLYEWNVALENAKIIYEFIIVEDGSTDNTKEIISSLEKNYPLVNLSQNKRRGYTQAVLDGITSAKSDYILCTDSDNQIKIDSLISCLDKLPNENEFLIGYRSPRKDPFVRIVYSKLFKILHDLLFNSKLKDPSCPFVLGKKETFQKLPLEELRKMKEGFWWGFVGIAILNKIKFQEIIIKHYSRMEGESLYKFSKLFGIIFRNTIGLFRIKYKF